MTIDPAIAFRVREHEEPALEVRVNFGVFAGREVTPAEIDDLARDLHKEIDTFTIVAEQRHEFGGVVEVALHQVVVEVSRDAVRGDADEVCERIVAVADRWAQACIAARHAEISDDL